MITSYPHWCHVSVVNTVQSSLMMMIRLYLRRPQSIITDLLLLITSEFLFSFFLIIGRYWTADATGDCQRCHYTGTYRPTKCQVGCDRPTQRWYHVPRSWLKPTRNILVLFEEFGGNPTGISLAKRSMTSVCADMFEYRPNNKDWHTETNGRTDAILRPKIHLQCGPGLLISSIKFPSFGSPLGSCGNFRQGTCHAPTSYDVLNKKCIGKKKCAVTISNSSFGQDPCPNTLKRLTIEVVCAPTSRG